MSTAYQKAVEEKKLGDAARKKGNKQLARMHYQRAIGALKIYAKSANSEQRVVAQNIMKKILKIMNEISGSAQIQEGDEFDSIEIDRFQRSKEIPDICKESGGYVEFSKFCFDDLAGMEQVKMELRDAIELPLKYPDEFKRRGIPSQTGILLFGPPGCGKTYLVKCLAGEFGLPAVIVSASQLLESLVGATEKKAEKSFVCARKLAPSILFVDEIDKLLSESSRSDSTQVMTRTTNEFLTQLDGFSGHEQQSIFIAATNEPENINPALIRPGRVSQIIYVGAPDDAARKEVFKIGLRGNKIEGVDYNDLVTMTRPVGGYEYSSAAITEICTITKKSVVREQDKKGVTDLPITMKHFKDAIHKIKPTVTPEMKKRYDKFAKTHASMKTN
ncbi:MAG: ATP-binding protein [Candidatus Thorarchaeota archaeon]|nr:ATP-binding protein [Candidatus Thorarchaeota archaeon]